MPRTRGSLVGSLALVIAAAMPAVAGDGDAEQAIRDAAASYAAAFNEGDLKGIAAQWAEQAELVEAEVRLSGRQQIMSAIEAGLARNPGMTIDIDVDEVVFLSPKPGTGRWRPVGAVWQRGRRPTFSLYKPADS